MNKGIVVIILFLGALLVLLALSTDTLADGNQQSPMILQAQTKSEAQVEIKVAPVSITDGDQWKFDITLDTHTVDLGQDLMENAFIVDGSGKVYRPISWQGDLPGGHHRQGILLFNAISPVPEVIELKIQNISGVPERVFQWQLKN